MKRGMMKILRRGLFALTLILVLVPATAWATIGQPVSLKMETPDAVPVPGEIFHGTLVLQVGSDGWVEVESMWGTGWSRLGIDGSAGYDARPGETISLPFSGTPSADFGAIHIEYSYDDHPLSMSVDLRHLDPRGNRRPLANLLGPV